MNAKIINITLRLVLGFSFLAPAVAYLFNYKFFKANVADIKPWFTAVPVMGSVIAVLLLLISFLLLTGIKTSATSLAAAGVVTVNHIFLLTSNRLYNTFSHSVPLLGFALFLAYVSAQDKLQVKRIAFLLLRIFAGSIFVVQGLYPLITKGPIVFAQKLYVEPFANSFVPSFLLWIMGFLNPFIELVGGLLLIAGYKTKWGAALLSLFLASIVFGHMLSDPYETSGKASSYVLNNLAFVIVILWMERWVNSYSIDNYILKKRGVNKEVIIPSTSPRL